MINPVSLHFPITRENLLQFTVIVNEVLLTLE